MPSGLVKSSEVMTVTVMTVVTGMTVTVTTGREAPRLGRAPCRQACGMAVCHGCRDSHDSHDSHESDDSHYTRGTADSHDRK